MNINRSKKSRKKGLTLVEMMIAILIFTIAMIGIAQLFKSVWNTNGYTIEMGQSSLAASQGVNTMVGYIRATQQGDDGSYPIVSANNQDLVLFSDYNKDGITERLHFYLSGGNLMMGVTNPTTTLPKTYPSGDQKTITIASNVVNNSSTPIFYYYNSNYPGDTTNNPLTTPAAVANISLIKILLTVNTVPNRVANNIQTQSFVELRNLNPGS